MQTNVAKLQTSVVFGL